MLLGYQWRASSFAFACPSTGVDFMRVSVCMCVYRRSSSPITVERFLSDFRYRSRGNGAAMRGVGRRRAWSIFVRYFFGARVFYFWAKSSECAFSLAGHFRPCAFPFMNVPITCIRTFCRLSWWERCFPPRLPSPSFPFWGSLLHFGCHRDKKITPFCPFSY